MTSMHRELVPLRHVGFLDRILSREEITPLTFLKNWHYYRIGYSYQFGRDIPAGLRTGRNNPYSYRFRSLNRQE